MLAAELARRMDRSESTVSRLLRGSRKPSIQTMKSIEEQLGWPVASQIRALDRGSFRHELARRMYRQPT